ncbi:MAG TPA: hypothetical protein PK622_06175 [Saprospiraceae bacterium]|nr:hypothetical protein [Saprospiraceae bacterium]HUN16375.1 hypothetical protein [Saprospiraceae bacterium]
MKKLILGLIVILSLNGFANSKHIPECPDDLTDMIESTSLKVGKNEICRSESGKYVIYAVLDQNGKFSRLLAHDLSGKELGKSGPPKTTKTAKTKSGGKKNVVKYFELCLMVNGVQVCKFYLLKE